MQPRFQRVILMLATRAPCFTKGEFRDTPKRGIPTYREPCGPRRNRSARLVATNV